jgi:short-subunit dehydrogenase
MPELKTVLISGASEGIGRCFAEVFARQGHDLILVARNQQKLEQLADELRTSHGAKVHVLSVDLIPADAPSLLFERLAEMHLSVDILVNNAGMMLVEKLYQSDSLAINNIMQLNVQSLVNMTHLFLAPMVGRGRGKILNVGSVASFMPTPNFSIYGASKAFVLSFSEGISEELKGTGVTVTCVCPGITETQMVGHAQGVEKYIPGFMKADPMTLAKDAYKACMKGEVVYVDKLVNKALVQWARHYPRWMVRGVNGLFSKFS